ncbi:hypothetical protein [ANMV-1 virus]|nr:hypothetical protein [ANMV-1 virus]
MGGNYNNTDKAGVFNTNINNTPADTNVNISFRAACLNTCFPKGLQKQVHLFKSWSIAPNTKKIR